MGQLRGPAFQAPMLQPITRTEEAARELLYDSMKRVDRLEGPARSGLDGQHTHRSQAAYDGQVNGEPHAKRQ